MDKIHTFSHNGYTLRYDSAKPNLAIEKKLKELLETCESKLDLAKIKDKAAIGWTAVFEINDRSLSREFDEVMTLLRSLRVLTMRRSDSWEIMDKDKSLNPKHGRNLFFFIRRVDILAYARILSKTNKADWTVVHHDMEADKRHILSLTA